jgi:NifU-like protein involved in Fe-S cluster formation
MLALDVKNGVIESVIHNVRGCLLFQAAASAIGAMAPGMEAEAMVQVSDHMAAMLKGETAYASP